MISVEILMSAVTTKSAATEQAILQYSSKSVMRKIFPRLVYIGKKQERRCINDQFH